MSTKIGNKCAECGDTPEWLYLHSRCHINYPTWVRVRGDVLEVICVECEELVGRFTIKERGE